MFWLLKYLLYLSGGGITLTTGLASYLAFLQPSFYFPKPTGQYAVGTSVYHWVDENQKELMGQIWYPAHGEPADRPAVPYAPYVINHLKKRQPLPWLLTMARPMLSYAEPHANLIEGNDQFPVIIFSHGFSCNRNSNTAHCEALASHGYIVVGLSHSYGCGVVEFSDGRKIAIDQGEWHKQFLQNPMANFELMNERIDVWIEDAQLALDKLERLVIDRSSPFYNRLDMNNIGIFGHSYGGATAHQICRLDGRIKAGVNMDGALFGPDATKQCDKPFMFLLSPQPSSESELLGLLTQMGMKQEQATAYAKATYNIYVPAIDELVSSARDVYKVSINHTAHMAFCDFAIIKESTPLRSILQNFGAGKLDGYRATKIINAHLVAFFDQYLKGQSAELLHVSALYPEVEMQSNQPA